MKKRRQEEETKNKILEVTIDANDENVKRDIELIHNCSKLIPNYSKKTKNLPSS
jgi:hypothetical protein